MYGIACAFEGFCATDPEYRFTASGTAIWSVTVGVQTKPREHVRDGQPVQRQNNDDLQWCRVVAWGEKADALNGNEGIVKGTPLYVEGTLTLNQWTGREGEQRSGLNVTAFLVQPMGQIGRAKGQKQQPPTGTRARRPAPSPGPGTYGEDDEDGLPF